MYALQPVTRETTAITYFAMLKFSCYKSPFYFGVSTTLYGYFIDIHVVYVPLGILLGPLIPLLAHFISVGIIILRSTAF